jgi:catechol 2,3-dioxygenase-like lactoylglutathione lyase family enzyme
MATSQIGDVRVVAIPVTDQDAALRFYGETLGFTVQMDVPMPGGGRWVMVAPAGSGPGSASVALVRATEDAPAGVETGIRFHAPDAESVHGALHAAGVTVGELLRWPRVPAMFQVTDPDGNRFEVIE